MMAVHAMLFREAKIRTTNFTFLFWDLCYPLGYLLVFSVGINDAVGSPLSAEGVDYQSFFLGGVLGMASFGIAANTAWGFFMDRDSLVFQFAGRDSLCFCSRSCWGRLGGFTFTRSSRFGSAATTSSTL